MIFDFAFSARHLYLIAFVTETPELTLASSSSLQNRYKFRTVESDTNNTCKAFISRDWTELHWAVWCQDLESVKKILALKKNKVNARDSKGWAPLHLACCSHKSTLWSTYMVARGLRADQGSGLYLTRRPGANLRYPTLAYTYSNPVENPSTNDADQPELGESSLSFMIALELLQAGADVSADASGFYTALHCAASSGWIDHIDALCSFGSPLYNPKGCHPACLASGPNLGHRRSLDYLRKRMGHDAWERMRDHDGCISRPLPPFSWPTKGFESFELWYLDVLVPNTSRHCLPGALGAVVSEETAYFCALCARVSLENLRSRGGYLHAKSLQALKLSAARCSSCRFLFNFLDSRLLFTNAGDVSQVILRLEREAPSRGISSVLKLQLSCGCYCHCGDDVESRSLRFSQCLGSCRLMLMEDIGLDIFTDSGMLTSCDILAIFLL